MADKTQKTSILCAKNRIQVKKFEKEEDCFILEFNPTSSPGEVETQVKGTPCAKNRDQVKKLEKVEDCFILDFDPCNVIDFSKLSLSKASDEAGSSDLSVDVRSISCAKNREQVRKLEKKDDCFIIEFDPYDEIDISKLSLSKCSHEAASADLSVIAEKGKVACRDYPHSRHNCAKYPFEKTPHGNHCELCYCYVCDSAAPCKKWAGSSGHCHAFKSGHWDMKREARKLKVACRYPHFRHNCAKYPFDKMPHDKHCKQCYCYVCDLAVPCPDWVGSSGHCHAFKSELWDKKRNEVAFRDLPHFRHRCEKYPFNKTPHENHCKLCHCYVCDSAAPCPMWLGSSGHCNALNSKSWRRKREASKE